MVIPICFMLLKATTNNTECFQFFKQFKLKYQFTKYTITSPFLCSRSMEHSCTTISSPKWTCFSPSLYEIDDDTLPPESLVMLSFVAKHSLAVLSLSAIVHLTKRLWRFCSFCFSCFSAKIFCWYLVQHSGNSRPAPIQVANGNSMSAEDPNSISWFYLWWISPSMRVTHNSI